MEPHQFPAGSVIFNVGDPATSAFSIRAGTVELVRGNASDSECLVQLGPGEVFGETSLIDQRPHSLTARAVSDVQLCVLTRSEFEKSLTENPTNFRGFLKTLFESQQGISVQLNAATATALATIDEIWVSIHPLTRRSAATLPKEGLMVTKYPFRIGRAAAEHEEMPRDLNDLWLNDQIPFSVSRSHALIDRVGDKLIVKDRGSSLGTYVNETQIGGKSLARQAALEEGDNIVVLGGAMSPYQFRINVNRQ